jgi:hypothetical protein
MSFSPLNTQTQFVVAQRLTLLKQYVLQHAETFAVVSDKKDAAPCPAKVLEQAGWAMDDVLSSHLLGPYVHESAVTLQTKKGDFAVFPDRIGAYTFKPDGSVGWMAIDIDGPPHKAGLQDPEACARKAIGWCAANGVPAHLERSRSGSGWHIWVFFEPGVTGEQARRLGLAISLDGFPCIDGTVSVAAKNHGVEVFPKQIKPTTLGNMVYLPWHHSAAPGNNEFYKVIGDGKLQIYEPASFATLTRQQVKELLAKLPQSWVASVPTSTQTSQPSQRLPSVYLGAEGNTGFADAVRRYNTDHPGTYPAGGGECPTCEHKGCFGQLADEPQKWACFSANHEADSDGTGRAGNGCWFGDALDIDTHDQSLGRAALLRRDGYLGPQVAPLAKIPATASIPSTSRSTPPLLNVPNFDSEDDDDDGELCRATTDAIDKINPQTELLYDMRNDEFFIKDYSDKWILPGFPRANFATWLIGKGLGRKAHDAYIREIRQFTQRAPVYSHPAVSYLKHNGQDTFNTYVPSDVQASFGNWDDIREVLLNLVNNDPAAFDYLVQWLAAPVQSIRKLSGAAPLKMGTAIVFQGDQGAGKGLLHSIMRAIYGPTNVGLLDQDALDGRFNEELIDKLFVTANEVMSSTNRGMAAANKLKMWITDEQIPIELKHKAKKLYQNTMNLIITANDESPVIIEPSDRRFTVFKSSKLDPAIGRRVYADVKSGGPQTAAFLDYLMTVQVTITFGDRFETEARSAIQETTLPSEIKFLRAVRDEGWIAVSLPWADAAHPDHPRLPFIEGTTVLSSTLAEVYQDWCKRNGLRARDTSALTRAVKKAFPAAKNVLIRHAGTRPRCWTGLPPQPPDWGDKVDTATCAHVLPRPPMNTATTPPAGLRS